MRLTPKQLENNSIPKNTITALFCAVMEGINTDIIAEKEGAVPPEKANKRPDACIATGLTVIGDFPRLSRLWLFSALW
jgi:hypothetical protein